MQRNTLLIGALVSWLACVAPGTATAQLDTLLKTFLQNAAPPASQPQPPYYPPSGAYAPPPPAYYGHPRPMPSAVADRQRAAEMQRMLDDLGYNAGQPNGVWGKHSRDALRSFLRDHGQPVSGDLTPISQAAVRSVWNGRGQPSINAVEPASGAHGPSFDCARATIPTEVAICRDASLSALDQQLSSAFRRALATAVGNDAAALVAAQRAWVRQRNACGANDRCLSQTMTARLTDLHETRQDAGIAPNSTANEPAATIGARPEQGPASGQSLAPEQAVADNGDPLARLVHPQSELRPWPLVTMDGRLFIGDGTPSTSGIWGPGTSTSFAFGQILAMATLPGYLDKLVEYNVSNYVSGLFTDKVGKAVFGGGGPSQNGWTGSNEFESQRSRQTFDSVYAPMLRDLAPKLPFELRSVERVIVGSYDPARGGFPLTTLGATGPGSRQRLALLPTIESEGFVLAPGFTMPDLFWPVAGPAAEIALHRLPQRLAQLAAVIEVASVEPSTKEIALRLRTLSLYSSDRSTRLYDFPIAPDAGSTQAPAQPSTFATAALATAVPGPGAASANGADAVHRWRLPTLQGLPLIAPDSARIQLSFYGTDSPGRLDGMTLRAPTEESMPPSALWARAIQSLALASAPGASGQLTDQDGATLACLYLPPTTRTQMFGQDSCRFQPAVAGAEFALKDGAAAFRTRELPKIIDAAPRLPLRLLVVLETHSDRYDEVRSGFDLRYMQSVNQGPARLFGSTLDVPLPGFWPASKAEARTFLASQTDTYGSRQWLAMSVTIVGTTPGSKSGPLGVAGAGLPGGAAWRFRTDDMTLYADPALRLPLHHFATPQRLPQPIMGTPEEQAPRPTGPMPVGGEAALLALLHQGIPPDLAIDWHAAALARAMLDRFLESRPDWQDADAWGVFFPHDFDPGNLDTATVERYRDWTVRRAAALPETFTIWRRLRQAADAPQPLPIFTRSAALDEFMGAATAPANLAPQMRSRGIEDSQLLPLSFYLPGNQFVSMYVAVPEPRESYRITIPNTGPAARPSSLRQSELHLVVQNDLAGVDVIHFADGKATAIVLRLVPRAVDIREGAAVVATVALPEVGWAAAQAAKTASARAAAEKGVAEAKARNDDAHAASQAIEASVRRVVANALTGVPYGPDIVGLRLGMGMAEAEDAIRHHMTVGAVLDGTSVANGTGTHDLGPVRIFVNADKTEQIVLLDRSSGKVLGIRRTVAVAEALSDEQLLASLRSKYGPPLLGPASQGNWAWGQSETAPCVIFSTMTTQVTLREGPPPPMGIPARYLLDARVGFITPWDYQLQPAPSLTLAASCEARLEVLRSGTRMYESVYDARIFAVQATEAAAKVTSQAAPPPL